MSRRISVLLALGLVMASMPAVAFDLEDYVSTYRATRDAVDQAQYQLLLTMGPYNAMRTLILEEDPPIPGFDDEYYWPMPEALVKASCENHTNPNLGKALGDFYRYAEFALPMPLVWEVGQETGEDAFYQPYREWRNQRSLEWGNDVPVIGPELAEWAGGIFQGVFSNMIKAANEYAMALPSFKAARDAYYTATKEYTDGLYRCGSMLANKFGVNYQECFYYGNEKGPAHRGVNLGGR